MSCEPSSYAATVCLLRAWIYPRVDAYLLYWVQLGTMASGFAQRNMLRRENQLAWKRRLMGADTKRILQNIDQICDRWFGLLNFGESVQCNLAHRCMLVCTLRLNDDKHSPVGQITLDWLAEF